MTARSERFGFGGQNRSFASGDAEKVRQAAIHEVAAIDEKTKRKQQQAFIRGLPVLTSPPENGNYLLEEGECAFRVRGSNAVLSKLNGLEAPLMREYGNNPELVRALLESMVQPIGFVVQTQNTVEREPLITVATGGSYSIGSPGQYNVPGQENAHITLGCDVVMGVPNLREPIQFGNRSSGKAGGAVTLQPRAADRRAAAVRVSTVLGAILSDPEQYSLAMHEHQRVARASRKAAVDLTESYQTAALMVIHQLIKAKVLQAGAGLQQDGAALGSDEEAVTRIAEGLGLVKPSTFAQSRTTAQQRVWTQARFDIKQAMFQLPNPQSGARNSKYEFGYTRQGDSFTSIARSDDDPEHIRRTPAGELLRRQLTHLEKSLEAMTELLYEERRLVIGRANSSPSNAGTGIFQVQLQPGGGLANH